MKVGYARVSTFEQDLDLQLDALNEDGCDRIFCDKGESEADDSRPEWDNCLDHLLCPGYATTAGRRALLEGRS